MTFTKPDKNYWERKFNAYLHDPIDKVFRIQGHETRAAQFIEKFGLQKPNDEFWKKADSIAAGFERGYVPSYSSDPNKNGAVNFTEYPIITHPTSQKAQLKIQLPHTPKEAPDNINEELNKFIEREIGMEPGEGGYSDKFKGDEDRFAVARFLYTHLALRFRLAEENIGNLGAFWHRIPADSRFPDHSIWQHNALCSALCSCMELARSDSEIGIMVFSITPVQQFIARARKLRDYWTGSVLLSWLAFEGIRWVVENLGPDHILYPSLVDQPLINEYLKKEWQWTQDSFLKPPKDIATLPNKFLILVPMNIVESIAGEIKKHIHNAWKGLNEKTYETCISMMADILSDDEKSCVKDIFERQNDNFWDLQWAASYLVADKDKSEIEKLLPEAVYKTPFDLLKSFNNIIEDKAHYDKSGRGALYSVTHSLVQSALAVSKTVKNVMRPPEPGEKCHQCGEFEVLHHKRYPGDIPANEYKTNEYKTNVTEFWRNLKSRWDGDEKYTLGFNLNDNERLCSICLIKRMACKIMEGDKNHILHQVLSDKGFPSTTHVALASYFKRGNISYDKQKEIAQRLHEKADDKAENHDRYYAILLMDGDNMGKLVNGETLASTWKTIMPKEIVDRIERPQFEKKYHDNWRDLFDKKRLVTPAIHAAISESLGDFSLYGVARIIKEQNGTLIYAGGDDVCAVLPVETAFNAAQEIHKYYTSEYKLIKMGSAPEDISDTFVPAPGKLSINLGNGSGISISAAILLCHHKESLTQMIQEAHHLLNDIAKKEPDKNSCAIELRKRSGGSRFFVRKWSDKQTWASFSEIGNAIKDKDKSQVSSSLVYRLEQFRNGIEAILEHENWKEYLKNFFSKQLDRSSVGNDEKKDAFAGMMVDVVIDNHRKFKPEGLIIAGFMANGGENNGMV